MTSKILSKPEDMQLFVDRYNSGTKRRKVEDIWGSFVRAFYIKGQMLGGYSISTNPPLFSCRHDSSRKRRHLKLLEEDPALAEVKSLWIRHYAPNYLRAAVYCQSVIDAAASHSDYILGGTYTERYRKTQMRALPNLLYYGEVDVWQQKQVWWIFYGKPAECIARLPYATIGGWLDRRQNRHKTKTKTKNSKPSYSFNTTSLVIQICSNLLQTITRLQSGEKYSFLWGGTVIDRYTSRIVKKLLSSDFRVVKSTHSNFDLVAHLNNEVFVKELGYPETTATQPDKYEADSTRYFAFKGERPIGTFRIVERRFDKSKNAPLPLEEFVDISAYAHGNNVLEFSKFLMIREERNNFYGFALLCCGAYYGIENNFDFAFVTSVPHAVSIFTKVGFSTFAQTFYNSSSNIMTTPMVCSLELGKKLMWSTTQEMKKTRHNSPNSLTIRHPYTPLRY